jgi:hypothetical protein
LGNDLIIPTLLKSHHISQILSFECNYNLVKESVILVLHVLPIYQLRDGNWLILGKDHGLIKVMLKEGVKPIVSDLPLLEPSIFLPFLSHGLSLNLVADLLAPSRILGLLKERCPHVDISLWNDCFHIKCLFFIIIAPFSFLLNLIPCCPHFQLQDPFLFHVEVP